MPKTCDPPQPHQINRKFQNMRKRIKARIEKAKIQSEFNIEIVAARKGYKWHREFIESIRRDEDGNHITKDGELILTHVKTDSGKTMTPSKQFQNSPFSPKGQMLRELRKQRLGGSEVGLDK